ncbi:MAG: efflux RND transporter periplasmic adaptor subunit [Burkholderiales bacterium]|jgi:membrane fusion protein (multidrug efflux system)|nr:efflux RND transporter periplasmic adaptor subunit [Burkholderiales bacterium]
MTAASVALAVAVSQLAACQDAPPDAPRPPPQVQVVTVQPRTIPYVMTFVAQTQSARQVDIVARVSGYLDHIGYREGELVRQGQVLFQLDPRPLRAQLDAARGELQAQQARLTTAAATLGRVKPLAAMNAMSQADLDRAEGDHAAAKAAVAAARAKVDAAKLELDYASIVSPVTGLASRSLLREGAYVNAQSGNAKLTYVAALDPIWVDFSVSQNQSSQLRARIAARQVIAPASDAWEVELVMADGSVHPQRGRINFADPSFSQDTGSFLVRAVLPNPDRVLRPGMFVTARVVGPSRPDAVVLPQLAVQQGPSGHYVYVVKPDGTAEIRPVVVGDYEGTRDIVIDTGLAAGDRVVIDGMLKVAPGKPVTIVTAPAGAGAPAAAAAAAPTSASAPAAAR